METIVAGGYNVQCLHYRVLVTPITDEEAVKKTNLQIVLGVVKPMVVKILKKSDTSYIEIIEQVKKESVYNEWVIASAIKELKHNGVIRYIDDVGEGTNRRLTLI